MVDILPSPRPPRGERTLTGEVRLRLTYEALGVFSSRPVYVLQVRETFDAGPGAQDWADRAGKYNLLSVDGPVEGRQCERWRDVCDRDLTIRGLELNLNLRKAT